MKYITKLKLAAIYQACDIADKSTEYTMQFMMDAVNVNNDCVVKFLSLPDKELNTLREELNDLIGMLNEHDWDFIIDKE